MKIYKLTDQNKQTYNKTQWGEGITHTTTGKGKLCGPGWLHCYHDPLLAILLNPIHANIKSPILWEGSASGWYKQDAGLKFGYTEITLIKQIDAPVVSVAQHVRFGILCALAVYTEPTFGAWAAAWLDKTDRSASSAARAEDAVRANAAEASSAAWAAVSAAKDAVRANAAAAWAAVSAAEAAAWASLAEASSAVSSAAWAAEIDLSALCRRACAEEIA